MAAAVHEEGGNACETDFPNCTATHDVGIAGMSTGLAVLLTCNICCAGCSPLSTEIPPDDLKPLAATGKI